MKYHNPIMLLFSISLFVISCSSTSDDKAANDQTKEPQGITVKGVVRAIEQGKDGYVAKVFADDSLTYAALVSIVNLGGPENFEEVKIGDKVTFKGMPYDLAGEMNLMVEKIIDVETTRSGLTISDTSFRGITVGDAISDHTDYIAKEEMQTGEGTFEIYSIKDFNNNPAGYFLPDPNDESLVGDITVETLMAETAEGIKVGSTFGELKRSIPEIEVHGSEIEGRTHAVYGNLSYRLNMQNYSYEVNMEEISLDTEIVEITINRSL